MILWWEVASAALRLTFGVESLQDCHFFAVKISSIFLPQRPGHYATAKTSVKGSVIAIDPYNSVTIVIAVPPQKNFCSGKNFQLVNGDFKCYIRHLRFIQHRYAFEVRCEFRQKISN